MAYPSTYPHLLSSRQIFMTGTRTSHTKFGSILYEYPSGLPPTAGLLYELIYGILPKFGGVLYEFVYYIWVYYHGSCLPMVSQLQVRLEDDRGPSRRWSLVAVLLKVVVVPGKQARTEILTPPAVPGSGILNFTVSKGIDWYGMDRHQPTPSSPSAPLLKNRIMLLRLNPM
ncbi:hypothetical protein F5880DRAFT_1190090 [Lentinula raphanica]|nr:hypothetical protein F5880DRAFT_1190090 [Lentinula raphanica]